MGITPAVLRALMRYLPAKRVFSLAYPDLVMRQDDLELIAGIRTTEQNTAAGEHGRSFPFPETLEAFRMLGTERFRCIDVVALRGVEEVADLNEPCEFGLHDLVIDAGTTEHCANIYQATLNAAHAVDDGGVIFHQVPLSMVNHGFWCPQPTFYADLYEQNGWSVDQMFITDGERCVDIHPHARVSVQTELSLCVSARRRGLEQMRAPVQFKYLSKIGGAKQ